eukprot:3042376-Prymnesium_polylepis.1
MRALRHVAQPLVVSMIERPRDVLAGPGRVVLDVPVTDGKCRLTARTRQHHNAHVCHHCVCRPIGP